MATTSSEPCRLGGPPPSSLVADAGDDELCQQRHQERECHKHRDEEHPAEDSFRPIAFAVERPPIAEAESDDAQQDHGTEEEPMPSADGAQCQDTTEPREHQQQCLERKLVEIRLHRRLRPYGIDKDGSDRRAAS